MPPTENMKVKAKETPIKTIRRALSCSFVSLRCEPIGIFSIDVFGADAERLALRRITFRLLPILEFLAFITSPTLILTTAGKP
jgi:hypothetical protein